MRESVGDARAAEADSREVSANAREASADAREATASKHGATVDRDALLKMLFPHGVPAREEVIRAATDWLDAAERLANMR